jgi:uncharacterized membrane protein YedE/YeeE
MKTAVALLCGVLFGAGLAVSGMTNPAKVLAFLDVLGDWDPTLAFVMAGALAVSTAGYAVARRRERAWLGDAFAIPTRRDLDASLLGGAALFGVGWGLVGLCPGPALANLSRGAPEIAVFVGAMLAGIVAHRLLTGERRAAADQEAASPASSRR